MATETKFIKEICDEFLLCKICNEMYRDPKTLSCLHAFCADCVQQHIDAERERTNVFSRHSRYITCPLCSEKTEIPTGGSRRLPDNFLLSNLTHVVNRRRSVKVPSCEICQTTKSCKRQASSKCLECGKLLCKSCVELHRKTKVTENHSLFDAGDEKDIECKIHPGEVVRFFCQPCETCVCILCTFQEHRDHEVCSFNEGFTQNKAALETLLNRCDERANALQSLLNEINRCEALKKETQESIRDLAISYTAQVRAMERKLLKKLDSVFDSGELNALCQRKDWIRESLDSIKSTCNLTNVILKDNNLEMLLLKKDVQSKLNVLLEPSLPSVPEDVCKDIKFIPGNVKLGYLSVLGGSSDGDLDTLSIHSKCMDTQTDVVELDDTATTMGYNITQPIHERCKEIQTDALPVKKTVHKDVNTVPLLTRDKAVPALTVDVKSKGTSTEKSSYHTMKIQTDKLLTYDKESSAVFYGKDVALNTPLVEKLNKGIYVYPDMTSIGLVAKLDGPEFSSAFAHKTIETQTYSEESKISVDQPSANNSNWQRGRTRSLLPIEGEERPVVKTPAVSQGVQTAEITDTKFPRDCSTMTDPVLVVRGSNPSGLSMSRHEQLLCTKCDSPVTARREQQTESDINVSDGKSMRRDHAPVVIKSPPNVAQTDPCLTNGQTSVSSTHNGILTDSDHFSDALTGNEDMFTDLTKFSFRLQQEFDDERLSARPGILSVRNEKIRAFAGKDFLQGNPPLLTRSVSDSRLLLPGREVKPDKRMCTTERATMYSPVTTCDRSTMALSICPADDTVFAACTQTQSPGTPKPEGNLFQDWLDNQDGDLSYDDKATSTESLVYMGLLSELDNIDELFFVPNVTLETVSSTTSVSDFSTETGLVEMLDQEVSTEPININNRGTQTSLSLPNDGSLFPDAPHSCPLPRKVLTSPVTDASTNTSLVRTMSRETSTVHRHFLSKSTTTHHVAKLEKSTNTARRMSRWDLSPISTTDVGVSTDSLTQADKDTMTTANNLTDHAVSTDSVFVDEKMAECIVKLKNVSERLHSPNHSSSDNNNGSGSRPNLARRKLPGLEEMLIKPPTTGETPNSIQSEEDRKKEIQELLNQTQLSLQRTKPETSRKVQPITTLRAKSKDKLGTIEEHYRSRSLPRKLTKREQLTGVRMGRQAMIPSRLPLLRQKSAPERIVTGLNQSGVPMVARSPGHTSPIMPQTTSPVLQPDTMLGQVVPSGLERRGSSQPVSLPAISETRTSSSCSAGSTASHSSLESSSAGTVSSYTIPHDLKKNRPGTLYSSSSSSVMSATEMGSSKKSAKHFMQKLLPSKKKTKDPPVQELPKEPVKEVQRKPVQKSKEDPKSPKCPKKSGPFVYMRQRIFPIKHDTEPPKAKKEKAKRGKSRSKTDIRSPSRERRELATQNQPSTSASQSALDPEQKQFFSIC